MTQEDKQLFINVVNTILFILLFGWFFWNPIKQFVIYPIKYRYEQLPTAKEIADYIIHKEYIYEDYLKERNNNE